MTASVSNVVVSKNNAQEKTTRLSNLLNGFFLKGLNLHNKNSDTYNFKNFSNEDKYFGAVVETPNNTIANST
jgi:hypothetical protein